MNQLIFETYGNKNLFLLKTTLKINFLSSTQISQTLQRGQQLENIEKYVYY
jgi:hypothetical protein